MSAPLTTRDALAKVIAQHVERGGGYYCSCSPADEDDRLERLPGSWEQHLADALLASGALIDATQARAQAYRDAASIVETFEDGPAAAKALAWMAGEEER